MAAVMIGIDPHKASHTAVAVDEKEAPLGEVRVRASAAQLAVGGVGSVLAGADLGGRGRRGPGLPAGPATGGRQASACLTCRPSWAPGSGCWPPGPLARTTPTTPAVAVAALRSSRPAAGGGRRSRGCAEGLVQAPPRPEPVRNQVTCRLHAVLCELVPGGVTKEIIAAQAAEVLEGLTVRCRWLARPRARRRVPR